MGSPTERSFYYSPAKTSDSKAPVSSYGKYRRAFSVVQNWGGSNRAKLGTMVSEIPQLMKRCKTGKLIFELKIALVVFSTSHVCASTRSADRHVWNYGLCAFLGLSLCSTYLHWKRTSEIDHWLIGATEESQSFMTMLESIKSPRY